MGPTTLVVGMDGACEIAIKETRYDKIRITKLKDRLLDRIRLGVMVWWLKNRLLADGDGHEIGREGGDSGGVGNG